MASLLTIVFTDVVESSATKRDISLGRDARERDHAYLGDIQARHFSLIRECAKCHEGREVSTMGDAFYLIFEDPVKAVRCSTDIQKRLICEPIMTPRGPLRLRIGIHSGYPEYFEGGFHGTDVDEAARVEATATAQQILLSSATYELVRHMTDVKFERKGEFALKGVDRVVLWEAVWNGGSHPTAVTPLDFQRRARRMRFLLGALAVVILLAALAGYEFSKMRESAQRNLQPVHKQITFKGNAYEPALSPDGKSIAYVETQFGQDDRLVMQALGGGSSMELQRGNFVLFGWSPDGADLLFHAGAGKELFVLSRLGGLPRPLGDGGMSCWSPDGSRIMTTASNPEFGIWLINKLTRERTRVPAPKYDWMWDIDWSKKTDMVLLVTVVQTSQNNQLWVMRSDGTQQRKVVEEAGILCARWSPIENSIYYLRGEGHATSLIKVSFSGKSREQSILATGLQTGETFTLSADASKLVYPRSQEYSNLWSVALPGPTETPKGLQRALTSGTALNAWPTVSPDGHWVAFVMSTGSKFNLYKMAINGGEPSQLTFLDSSIVTTPAWSPDGRRIAFICDQGGTPKIWVVSADGSALHKLDQTDASNTNYHLSWAPSSEIIYQQPGLHNLRRLNVDTQEERAVLPKDSTGWLPMRPIISPDAKEIAVNWNRNDVPGVWVISLEDGSERMIFAGDYVPDGWSPDGKVVYAVGLSKKEILAVGRRHPNRSRKVIDLPNFSYGSAITPDGRTVVISEKEEKSDVWTMENFDPATARAKKE